MKLAGSRRRRLDRDQPAPPAANLSELKAEIGQSRTVAPMIDLELRQTAIRLALIALAGVVVTAAPAQAQPRSGQAQGRRIAEAYCAQCHSLGAGPSPLKEAPPFATLHRRYPEGGGLEDLLGEGMIAPATPPEEGQPRMHPRMPQAHLDEDQIANLIAFLKAVQQP
jgi:mono/diheme cytochrome c family protein